MGKKRELRVSGLANIAVLLGKSAAVATAQAATTAPVKGSKEGVVEKTADKLLNWDASDTATVVAEVRSRNRRIIEAAVREGYNLGHAEALAQNNTVEELLQQQYESRTSLTMPAVVAAVMEQCGMDELMLDLSAVATVFTRTRVHFTHDPAVDGQGDVIAFRLEHRADVDTSAASDATFALAP